MKDMIDIGKLKTSHTIRALTRSDLALKSSDYIALIAEEFREARQPFYRIWYYQKQEWATGYTDEAIKFLKLAFNRIKKNEEMCQKVLSARRRAMKL